MGGGIVVASQIVLAKFDQLLYENPSNTGKDKYENTTLLVAALYDLNQTCNAGKIPYIVKKIRRDLFSLKTSYWRAQQIMQQSICFRFVNGE